MAVLDRPVAAFVAARRSGALTVVMREVSAVGGPVVLAVVTAAAGVLFGILRRRWGPAVVAAVAMAGSVVLTVVFKQVLGQPRPPLAGAVSAADGYAFPSVHAAVAAAAFGVLACLCAAGLRSWAGRVAIWATAAVLAAIVGISRVYLGVHWTTDVLGGWAFGACWAAVVITGWTAAARHAVTGRLTGPRATLAPARRLRCEVWVELCWSSIRWSSGSVRWWRWTASRSPATPSPASPGSWSPPGRSPAPIIHRRLYRRNDARPGQAARVTSAGAADRGRGP